MHVMLRLNLEWRESLGGRNIVQPHHGALSYFSCRALQFIAGKYAGIAWRGCARLGVAALRPILSFEPDVEVNLRLADARPGSK